MSDDFAKLYDTQVEILFSGATSAMRRQGLVPIAQYMAGKDQRTLRAVDLATGTGSFAACLAQSYPQLPLLGFDLSEPYARHAMGRFKRYRHQHAGVTKGEALPIADELLDLISTVFLFHELPPTIRVAVAREIARVIKPGGLFVFVDSLQPGDTTVYDGLLELFPQLFHEPYFSTYAQTDLIELFKKEGLKPVYEETAFVSKILAFEK